MVTHLCIALQNLPKEYHLVAMDMPGHGASTTPPASQELGLQFGMDTIKRVCRAKTALGVGSLQPTFSHCYVIGRCRKTPDAEHFRKLLTSAWLYAYKGKVVACLRETDCCAQLE